MFKNYFKTAWRNLVKSKGYSALNIFGLAIGMAVALLIGLWVYDQFSYNKFLPGFESVYQVKRNYNSNGDTLTFSTTSLRLAEALRNDIPEIEHVVESDWMGSHGLMVGEKKLYLRGAQSGSDFFNVFQYPLLKGNRADVLKDPYSIVLSESTAKSLFGDEDPINKVVRFDNMDDLKVSGIMKDIPHNSTFQIQWVVPFSYIETHNPDIKLNRTGSFGDNSYQIFVKLKPGVSYEQVAPKIRLITHIQKDNQNAMNSYVWFQPMKTWRLYDEYTNGQISGGFARYVKMFSIIGALILLIACINFVNLTTARSEKRAREVGVRKVIGSRRWQLIAQFLAESILLTFLSFILALALVQLALPSFNALTGTSIVIPFDNPLFWTLMIAAMLTTALIAGARPAFYLSSFIPIKVLKGTKQAGRSSSFFRRSLVVIQFTCSVALIISTLVIYRQVQHAKNRPTGYDTSRVLVTNSNPDLRKNYTALKNEILREGLASHVTWASSPATNVYWHTDVPQFPGKLPGESVEMGVIMTGEDYFKTLRMTIKEGRDFTNVNDTLSVIMNEAGIKRLRLKDPIGQKITWNNIQYTIVGVVKDALMISPYAPADPTMFYINANNKSNILYRLRDNLETSEALTRLAAVFNKFNPAFPYSYEFSDENYAQKFKLEILIGKLSGVFAALAIFISCLGLFGLAAYVAEQRTKEIGIRKVLGASTSQVWMLLSKDFVVLVLISCVVASPLANYFLQDWLQKYEYRIDIGYSVFIVAAVMALAITLVTISFQAIKAAMANPVKSLRSE
jgi:putative ABC transport system permease protein